MANHNAQGKQVKHEVRDQIRAGLEGGIRELCRRKEKKFSEIVADWLEESPIATLNAFTKYLPVDHNVNHTGKVKHEHRSDTAEQILIITEFIGQHVARVEGSDDAALVQDQSLLPDPVRVQSG